MQVIVKNNDVKGAMRRLKKKLFNEGVVQELMDRRFYEKPSDKKRRKRKEMIRKAKKDQAKREAAL